MPLDFAAGFLGLTGNTPFPWQRALYEARFARGDFPAACVVPAGLGKSAVIAIWVLALAANPTAVPRRLVYVVNRRTAVDQATVEAEKYRHRLSGLPELAGKLRGLCSAPADVPLGLCTMRGESADDREWMRDPARPTVVVGTVDAVGSRLLFSGSGCGFEARPLDAGLLGQDVLLVHDDAHLEPAFQKLAEAVRDEQRRYGEFRRFHVTALTTSPRNSGDVFRPGEADLTDAIAARRLGASKALHLKPLEDARRPAAELAAKALAFKDSDRSVLVFARDVDVVQQVVQLFGRHKSLAGRVEQLTGTLRGSERDRLVIESRVFARFVPHDDRRAEPRDGTVYLVCTAAGEVGANLSADHLVCDLAPFDAMAQRLGRVNRFGDREDSEAHVLHPTWFDTRDPLGPACERTLGLLRGLAGDASSAALSRLCDAAKSLAATPPPVLLTTTDVLFDAWALTTTRDPLPGRPPVGPYVRGVAGWEPADSQVAWREEVSVLSPVYPTNGERAARQAADRKRLARFAAGLLGAYPLMPHELLRDTTARVAAQLVVISRRAPYLPAWLLHPDGTVSVHTVTDLADEGDRDRLAGRTVILSPGAGGLSGGMLVGAAAGTDGCDVADLWLDAAGRQRRRRVRGNAVSPDPPAGMRLVREYDTDPAADDADGPPVMAPEEPGGRFFRWYARPAADDGSPTTAEMPVRWPHHTNRVAEAAGRLAATLFPDQPDLRRVLTAASRLLGLGKARVVWQRSIGNQSAGALYEAGGRGMRPVELTTYRHEFGSLLDAAADPAFGTLESDEERDLALHLVAAQSGRGRPHFPADEAFDPERPAAAWLVAAREAPRRYVRLQRRYGRWGLAYLEAQLRAAEAGAVAEGSAPDGASS